MFRFMIHLIAFGISVFTAVSAHAVIIPTGLDPGDSYHLAFVTHDKTPAASTDIEFYNTFVQDQAALNPTLTGTDENVFWYAIGSTRLADARDNAVVGADTPVYLLDGSTKITDGFADLWAGTSVSLDNTLSLTQFAIPTTTLYVWTGTNSMGTANLSTCFGLLPLGESCIGGGNPQDPVQGAPTTARCNPRINSGLAQDFQRFPMRNAPCTPCRRASPCPDPARMAQRVISVVIRHATCQTLTTCSAKETWRWESAHRVRPMISLEMARSMARTLMPGSPEPLPKTAARLLTVPATPISTETLT